MPRFRFKLEWMMVAVAIVAGTMAFLMSKKGSYWVRLADVPLRFTILDDASGRPISGASVRLPGSTIYEAPPARSDGKTAIVIRVMCSGGVSIFRSTRFANFSPWKIRVVATGYRTFKGSLEKCTLDPRFHEKNPNPPPIVIRMERESERPASESHR